MFVTEMTKPIQAIHNQDETLHIWLTRKVIISYKSVAVDRIFTVGLHAARPFVRSPMDQPTVSVSLHCGVSGLGGRIVQGHDPLVFSARLGSWGLVPLGGQPPPSAL